MKFYRIYVRLKSGGQATGRLHTGPPPPPGTEVKVLLITGRTIKARIGSIHRARNKRAGIAVSVTTEVHANEI
jgi:hypothetical protein